MQPDHGEACPGKASEEAKAFYFDPLSEKCAPMIYKGCGGNKNTFANTDNCINSCQTPYLVEKEKDQELAKSKKDCALPVGPGLCKAIIPMYYYDQEKGCSKFTYGGCGGNRNQFNTKEECDALCKWEFI